MKNYYLFIFFLLIHSISFSTTDYYDYIYTNNGYRLYNQSAILTSEQYQQANATQKEQLLVQAFLDNQQEAYGEVAHSLATYISVPMAMWLGKKFLLSKKTLSTSTASHSSGIETNFLVSNLITTIWGAFLYPIAWYFAEETTEVVTSFLSSTKRWWTGAPHDNLHVLEEKYAQNKPSYSKQWQTAIETNFIEARNNFRMRSQYLQQSTSKNPHLLFAELALSLPTQNTPIHIDTGALEKKLSQYKNMAHINGQNAVSQMIYFCEAFAKSSQNQNPNLKSSIYLFGPPGTGKTESVQLMAKALNVPVIKINLGEIKTVAELKGFSQMQNGLSVQSPGLLAQKLIDLKAQGYHTKNVLLFFDEADRTLNQIKDGQINEIATFMLELLEGKTKSIDNPYFKADLDVQGFGIILAGNSLLTKALQDRLDTVYFAGYSLDYRTDLGRDRFLKAAIQDYVDILKLEDFTKDELAQIDRFAQEEHRQMIPGKEIETEPGFREQQRKIQRFVHQKALQKTKESNK